MEKMQDKSLEQKLRQAISTVSAPQTVVSLDQYSKDRLYVLIQDKIVLLEKALNSLNVKCKDPSEKLILPKSPPNLTSDYVRLSHDRIISGIYTTDNSHEKWSIFAIPSEGVRDVVKNSDGTYSGDGAEFIKRSLTDRIVETALVLGSDLAIADFVKKKPCEFDIFNVNGFGIYKFCGSIKVSFYTLKKNYVVEKIPVSWTQWFRV